MKHPTQFAKFQQSGLNDSNGFPMFPIHQYERRKQEVLSLPFLLIMRFLLYNCMPDTALFMCFSHLMQCCMNSIALFSALILP